MKLVEYGQLNQTALVSYCGLNLKKHRNIFDKMEHNGLIIKTEKSLGKRTVTVYSASQKGLEFCRTIIEPYEKLFPRSLIVMEIISLFLLSKAMDMTD